MTPISGKLSEREELCLSYLDSLLWTDAFAVGRFIYTNCLNPSRGGSNLPAIGAAVLGRLKKRGFVTFLPDINAWRITKNGRDTLYANFRNVIDGQKQE